MLAKPVVYNLKEQTYQPPNSIGVGFQDANLELADKGVEEHARTWPSIAMIYATTDANRELMIEQTMKHTLAHGSTSLLYNISDIASFSKRGGVWMCTINFNEIKFITVSAF